jgi:small subunit ribosomal protein S16
LLRIRLKRQGRRNLAHFRIGVYDQRNKQKGNCVEVLGSYAPHNPKVPVVIDQARLTHHIGMGAQVSDHCAAVLKHVGINIAHPAPSKAKRHKRGKPAKK